MRKPRLSTRGFTEAVAGYVDAHVHDGELQRLLNEASSNASRYAEVLRRLERQLAAARRTILYPDQTRDADSLAQEYRPTQYQDIEACWALIVSDAGNVAQALWRAFDADWQSQRTTRDPATRVRQRLHAERVVLALRQMLHGYLYSLRAGTNQHVGADGRGEAGGAQSLSALLANFRERYEEIRSQERVWGVATALPRGEIDASYATDFQVWSRDFDHAIDDELGWRQFARAVGAELRYLRFEMELAQRWREVAFGRVDRHIRSVRALPRMVLSPLRLTAAIFVWLFQVTTGFGLRPYRFARTAVLTVATFTGLFYLDDRFFRPPGVPLEPFGRYLYYAVVYLTSVGADHSPAGVATPALIAIESIIGYFLLSVLAAMLFAWFTDR